MKVLQLEVCPVANLDESNGVKLSSSIIREYILKKNKMSIG